MLFALLIIGWLVICPALTVYITTRKLGDNVCFPDMAAFVLCGPLLTIPVLFLSLRNIVIFKGVRK